MADLDDFFAKKDKKKSKGKKFTTVDQVAKKLEDTGKKPLDVKPKKEKEKSGQDGENVANNMQEDDEWKEFEEEKKDYSGLKIQNMQLTDSADGSGGAGGDEDDSDDGEGEGGGRGRKAAGPWRMPTTQETNEVDSDEEEVQPEPEPKRPEPKETTSSYVPPHLRNQPPAGAPTHQSRLKSKTAPDINNEAYFPTLSAAAASEPVGAWGKKGRGRDDERGFEDVRNSKSHSSRFEGGRQAGAWGQGGGGGASSGRVTVENKFDALRQAEQS